MKSLFVLLLILFSQFGCKKTVNQPDTDSCLLSEGFSVYQFAFYGSNDTLYFNAATSDSALMRELELELATPPENRLKFINGLLAPGMCDHNPGYDWYFIPGEWELVESSIEWCDVFPANPDSTGMDRACPWSSRVYQKLN